MPHTDDVASLAPMVRQRPAPAAMLQALRALLGDRLSTAQAVREQHGRDESPFDVPPPTAVAFAQSTREVMEVVRLASEHGVPVIPFGAGSSSRDTCSRCRVASAWT